MARIGIRWGTQRWKQCGSFLRGAGESLALVAVFTALGLASAALRAEPEASYPRPPMEAPSDALDAPGSPLWLVDGFNAIQVALLRGRDREAWWSATRRRELLDLARPVAAAGEPVWVVFDGRDERDSPDPNAPLHTVFAVSADDWLLARVRAAPDPSRVRLVTADRRLAGRARSSGVTIVAPGEFVARCGDAGRPQAS